MDRRLLAAVAVVLVAGLSGCTAIFGANVDDPEALSADANYEFDTDYDASLVLNRDNYTAVYDVSSKTVGAEGEIELYTTDALAVERPLELRGLQFRYPNGTLLRYNSDGEVVRTDTGESVDALTVRSTRQRSIVELPAEEGQLAFTTPRNGKQLTVETPVNGSYEVALPPDTDATIPLLSQVRPENDDRREVGDRVILTWENLDTSVLVLRWYLDRDIWLFGGLAAIGTVLGLLGGAYYYLQIQRAKERRETEGIDIDTGDDSDGPPPGMR
jgi:hypothetical protein